VPKTDRAARMRALAKRCEARALVLDHMLFHPWSIGNAAKLRSWAARLAPTKRKSQ
jgi:hypothetical protein